MTSTFPPPPVPLADGEEVVLAGGRGWQMWLWTFALAPFACMLMPVSLIPVLFSGRYWLTQRRLIWKRTWAKPREMALADVTGVDVSGRRATVIVTGKSGKLALRLVSNWQGLWGAIVLFNQLPLPERMAPGRAVYTGQAGLCVEGKHHQAGYGVVHRGQFVFFPREKRHHIVADGAKVAGQVALALVGFHTVTYRAELPFALWLSMWSHLSDADFSALLERSAQARGGLAVPLRKLVPVEGRAWYRHGEAEYRFKQPFASA